MRSCLSRRGLVSFSARSVAEAAGEVVVYKPGGLKVGIDNGGSQEFKTPLPQA